MKNLIADFLQKNAVKKDVHVLIPKIDESLCTALRSLFFFCQFNALACIGKHALVFPVPYHVAAVLGMSGKAITGILRHRRKNYILVPRKKHPLRLIEGRLS